MSTNEDMGGDSSKRRTTQLARDKLLFVNLSKKLREELREDPSVQRATKSIDLHQVNWQNLVKQYAQFLAVKCLDYDFQSDLYSPCELVDKVWRQHILDTKKYCALCDEFAGGYVHRDPNIGEEVAKSRFAEYRVRAIALGGDDPNDVNFDEYLSSAGGAAAAAGGAAAAAPVKMAKKAEAKYKPLPMCNFKFHCGFAGCKDWAGVGPRKGTGDCNYTGMKKHYKDKHGFEPKFDNIDSGKNRLLYSKTLTGPSCQMYGVHAPGCIDGSLCSTDPKMSRCTNFFMAKQSIEMRKTVEVNYGQRKAAGDEYADPRSGLISRDVSTRENLTPAQAILMEGHAQAVTQGSSKMLRMCNNRFHCGFQECIKWPGLAPIAKTGDCNYSAMRRHYADNHQGIVYNMSVANNTETHMLFGKTPVADASNGESDTNILYFGVHAPGCNDGSLCCTRVKMMECPEDSLHDLSKSMRTTVNIAYGHKQDEGVKSDTTEDSGQKRQKVGHKAQGREIALKASQIATNPSQ